MAFLQRQRTQIRLIGERADVPNNDIAKLMYYLHCVCYCIDYNDNDISRYRNYSNWASLSDEEDRLVFALVVALSPDIFLGKIFFPSDALCGDMWNRFYEINQISHQFLVVPSLVIGGRQCKVNKIMTLKQTWLESYYIDPVRRLSQRFRSQPSRSSACVIS